MKFDIGMKNFSIVYKIDFQGLNVFGGNELP